MNERKMNSGFAFCAVSRILAFTMLTAVMLLTAPGSSSAERKKSKPAPVAAAAPAAPQTCTASLLMEPNSGDVLFEMNAREPLPPASMVKLMTAYTIFKRIKEGIIKLDDVVTVSAEASKIGGSQVYLKQGEQFSVNQLLEALLVQSANDGATALAQHLGGTPEGFAGFMNIDAQSIGMTQSKFFTPHGLPPAPGQQADVVSAYDFALLGRALIKEFPEVLTYTSKLEAPFRNGEFKMSNHNHLLRMFPGTDGLKTGFYNEAGFCVTATAVRNGMRMIAVVMGCPQRKLRENEAARLLSLGFAQYQSVTLAKPGQVFGGIIPVNQGEITQTQVVAQAEVKALVKTADAKAIVPRLVGCDAIQAPAAAQTPCGKVEFVLGDKVVGETLLVVPQDLPKAGLWQRIKRRIAG